MARRSRHGRRFCALMLYVISVVFRVHELDHPLNRLGVEFVNIDDASD